MNPVPKSVQSIEEKHIFALDNTFWALRFDINSQDLQNLIDKQIFTPINEHEEFQKWDRDAKNYIPIPKSEYLQLWTRRIKNTVNLDVILPENCNVFVSKNGRDDKYLFVVTNSATAEAVFVAEAH